jgi:hypothetical protein
MKYTAEYDETNAICIVRVSGQNKRPEDSMILQRFAGEFRAENGCNRFLFDMTQAEIIGGTWNTFLTGTVPADPDRKQIQQKIALLYVGDMSDHEFMETVAVNRGYDLRVFNDHDKAMDWLVSDTAQVFEAKAYPTP